MKIVLTGGGGFLGSWTASLLRRNHQVTLLGRLESTFNRINQRDDFTIVRKNQRDWPAFINSVDPDALILMDWEGVHNDFHNSEKQFDNVERLENLLSGLIVKPRIIGVGSQAEVGPCSGVVSEKQIDKPVTDYAKAKILARDILLNHSPSDRRVVWARVFSTYGNLDHESWFIPSLIKTLMKNDTFNMTQGEQIWSYLHAYDAARAFEAIINTKEINGIVNIGNPNPVVIKKIAEEVHHILGRKGVINYGALSYSENQVMEMMPDCTKLFSTGWKPVVDLTEGINLIIKEYEGENFSISEYLEKK